MTEELPTPRECRRLSSGYREFAKNATIQVKKLMSCAAAAKLKNNEREAELYTQIAKIHALRSENYMHESISWQSLAETQEGELTGLNIMRRNLLSEAVAVLSDQQPQIKPLDT